MDIRRFRERLLALGHPAPWRASETDVGAVLDDRGDCAATVDVNADMSDRQATELAQLVAAAVNAAAGVS